MRWLPLAALASLAIMPLSTKAEEPALPEAVQAATCLETHFMVEGYGCAPKPPTPDQRACLKAARERLIAGHAVDAATTGVALAIGGPEIGLAGVFGTPAAPVLLLLLKGLHVHLNDKAAARDLAIGEYDRACRRMSRNGIPAAGAAAFNLVQLVAR